MTHKFSPTFGQAAQKLVDNGYLPIPIKPDTKRGLAGWPNYRFKPEDAERYKSHSVGILTGQGTTPVYALDFDSGDKEILEYLITKHHLETCMVRNCGQVRSQLFFRSGEAGVPRVITKKYEDEQSGEHMMELRGAGNQSVIIGFNPDAGTFYQFPDKGSNPFTVKAAELPLLTKDQALAVLKDFEDYVAAHRKWKVKEEGASFDKGRNSDGSPFNWMVEKENRPEISIQEAESYLNNLPKEYVDTREEWVRVGMAIHFQFDGCDEAYQLYDSWSKKSDKYAGPKDTLAVWKSFDRDLSKNPRTFKSIISAVNANLKKKESEELVLLLSRIDAAEDQYQVQDVLKSAYLKDRLNIESIIVRAKGRLKELTGLSFKPALLKSFLPKADDKSIVGFTEDANAVRFIERYKGLVRYVVDQDKWLEFVGYYKEQTQKEVLEYARQTIAVLLDDMKRNGASAAEIAKVGMLFQKAAMYKHMLEIAAGDVAIAVRDEDLNTLTRYVAVQNGELDLKKVEFIPADPEHFITQCMGVAYDPKAECPIFKKVLSDAFYGDERMIKYFLRCVAYALLGDPVEQKYFTLLGGGANGKSTLINGILNVFGDYGDVTEASTVMGDTRSQGGQSREDLVRLKDKRLVVTMEPENNMPIKSGTVKALTGGEKIAARAMYKKTNTFQPRLTLFICANEELILRGSDYGLIRRESIIPFNKRFSEEERDKSFPAKLRAEGSGILNLILEALKDYYEVGLNPPEEVKTATQEHIDSQDILAEWLEDNFEFGPEYTVTTIAAFSNWKTYAEPRGLDGIVRNTRSLGKQLSGKGFRAIRNSYNIRGRGFLGLRLKDPEMNID